MVDYQVKDMIVSFPQIGSEVLSCGCRHFFRKKKNNWLQNVHSSNYQLIDWMH